MEARRRDQIQQSLRNLAESYRVTMELMEQTLAMLCEELSLDAVAYFQARSGPRVAQAEQSGFRIDPAVLSVHFRGKVCFLGNTLPFKFLCRLAQRPNAYVTYEDLLAEVWEGVRSDDAVRSVAKALRRRLRQAGLGELANAIDGTAPSHYALKLPP
jgi:DNA-binding response OmpR family regulator